MDNLDTGNIRHTINRTKAEINTTQHRMDNLAHSLKEEIMVLSLIN